MHKARILVRPTNTHKTKDKPQMYERKLQRRAASCSNSVRLRNVRWDTNAQAFNALFSVFTLHKYIKVFSIRKQMFVMP